MSLIVIVDDRATNRSIYARLAQTIGEGVIVRPFGDPVEALKWLGRNRPDLIVTDYDMPQIDGEEFISRFRGLPHSAGVPIMMITVCDQRKLRLRALESGATDFLSSPIDHYEFVMRARNLLKLSRGAESRGEGARPVPPPPAPAGLFPEARRFYAECAAAGPYALHAIALDEAAEAEGFAAQAQGRLRGGDRLVRIEPQLFVLLQKGVAGPGDAEACARRLAGLDAAAGARIGSALPQQGEGAAEERAEACLREALERARPRGGARTDARRDGREWRFLPRVDLLSGAIAGAQVMRAGAPAEIAETDDARAVLACIASLRVTGRQGLRFGLRLRPGCGGAATALRLAPLLSAARVAPARLDLHICAREALLNSACVQAEARALKALGVGLTLDLGALGPQDLRQGDQWAGLLGAFVDHWCDAVKFPCTETSAIPAARLLRRLLARRAGRAPLLADGVAEPEWLWPLARAGVSMAQGPCFGEPFAARDLRALVAARFAETTAFAEPRA